ncbi:MAG: hypothetical protein VX106_04485 [Pseudomonadota bacterium]|nr:hypothetical protein [Pseudomonadota bacterium]
MTVFASHLVFTPPQPELRQISDMGCKHHSGGLATAIGLANIRKMTKKSVLCSTYQDVDDDG